MDKENVMLAEFAQVHELTKTRTQMVAIYNSEMVSFDTVRSVIREGITTHSDVMIVTKTQCENIFGPIKQKPTAEQTDKIKKFLFTLPERKVTVCEYEALHDGEWVPVSRINKGKKTFALSHSGGELIVKHTDIEDIRAYAAD